MAALPRVLMMIDLYGWAFHTLAKGMSAHMPDYDIDIRTFSEDPDFSQYDLIHVFGLYQGRKPSRCPVLLGVYNVNNSTKGIPVSKLMQEITVDVAALTIPITSMAPIIRSFGIKKPIHMLPEGVDTSLFPCSAPPSGGLKIGWAGNPLRGYKRFSFAQLASKDVGEFFVADGSLSEEQMVDFYSNIDVILCTSEHGEGCPRPLIEGMSRGCFPVSFPVGVAPDIIDHQRSGLLVEDESISSMREALIWCQENIDMIRSKRQDNHNFIHRHRNWPHIAPTLSTIYQSVLSS